MDQLLTTSTTLIIAVTHPVKIVTVRQARTMWQRSEAIWWTPFALHSCSDVLASHQYLVHTSGLCLLLLLCLLVKDGRNGRPYDLRRL